MIDALSDSERERVADLVMLEQLLTEKHLASVRQRLGDVLRSVEMRLELPRGAIGTTHGIDFDTFTVMAKDEQ